MQQECGMMMHRKTRVFSLTVFGVRDTESGIQSHLLRIRKRLQAIQRPCHFVSCALDVYFLSFTGLIRDSDGSAAFEDACWMETLLLFFRPFERNLYF